MTRHGVADSRVSEQQTSRKSTRFRVPPRVARTVAAGAGTAVGSAFGALLPFAVTRWFGASRETDAYFLSATSAQLAGMVVAMVAEAVVLPYAARALTDSRTALTVRTVSMVKYAVGVAAAVTLALGVLTVVALLPTSDVTPEQRRVGYVLMVALAPFPLLTAASSVLSAGHYCLNRFGWPAASQSLRAGGGLLSAALLGPSWGIVAVAAGVTLGEALRTLLLYVTLPEVAAARRARAALSEPPGSWLRFVRVSSPALIATLIVSVNPLIDKAVAARLEIGSTTLIELAEKLFYVPMVLLARAVTTVSGTVWSQLMNEDEAALRRDYWRVQRVSAFLTVAIAGIAAIVVVGFRDVVAALLHLGPASPFVAVFVLYIVGLPAALAADLGGRLVVGLQRTSLMPLLALLLVVVNFVADVVGAAHFGILGIAIASTIVRLLNAAAFVVASVVILRPRQVV